jgi:hypothetical protein
MGTLWVLAQVAPNFDNDPGELGNLTESQEWGVVIAGLAILLGPFILYFIVSRWPTRDWKDKDRG